MKVKVSGSQSSVGQRVDYGQSSDARTQREKGVCLFFFCFFHLVRPTGSHGRFVIRSNHLRQQLNVRGAGLLFLVVVPVIQRAVDGQDWSKSKRVVQRSAISVHVKRTKVVMDQCINSAPTTTNKQCINNNASTMHQQQRINNASTMHQQCINSASTVHQQCINSASTTTHQQQ